MKSHRHLRFVLWFFCLFIWSCTSSKEDLWQSYKSANQNGEYQKGIHHLQKYLAKTEASEEKYQAHKAIAELYQYNTSEYGQALNHYMKAMRHASESSERIQIQTRIADTLFEKMNDYNQAIVEYDRLVQIETDLAKKASHRLRIALAYYHQKNLSQAFDEASRILTDFDDESVGFQAKLLQANIQLAQKELEKAAGTYESLIESYPEKASAEKIGLNLAMSYEELNAYDKAIATLERMKKDYPNPEYIQIRIDRIEKRQKSRPGARGLRR